MEPPEKSMIPKDLSDEELKDLCGWAHDNRGSILTIARMMTEMSGKPTSRQMVGRWLHRDKEQRQQPSHGHAILLRKCIELFKANQAAAESAQA